MDDHRDLNPAWLNDVKTIGVTVGASAPEHLVQDLLRYLSQAHGFGVIEEVEIKEEDVRFSLPSGLESRQAQLTTIAVSRT